MTLTGHMTRDLRSPHDAARLTRPAPRIAEPAGSAGALAHERRVMITRMYTFRDLMWAVRGQAPYHLRGTAGALGVRPGAE
jgi:hypothetical protein